MDAVGWKESLYLLSTHTHIISAVFKMWRADEKMERKGILFICVLNVRVWEETNDKGFFFFFFWSLLDRRDNCDLSCVVKSSAGGLFKNAEGKWKVNGRVARKYGMPSVGHGLAWSTWMLMSSWFSRRQYKIQKNCSIKFRKLESNAVCIF